MGQGTGSAGARVNPLSTDADYYYFQNTIIVRAIE
jgi:hypothetical protein